MAKQWQDDLLAVAQWSRTNMVSHPVVGHLRREFDVWTPSMLRVTERWLDLWQQSGLALNEAMLAATTKHQERFAQALTYWGRGCA
jgi:hypothetical protein